MDAAEFEGCRFVIPGAKLHGGMCRLLYPVVCRVSEIFPSIEAARPRSKSGMQALCSLHVAIDKAKGILQHCADCSKFYLAITGESILIKFEKARSALQESLRRIKDIVTEDVSRQIMEIVAELENIVFELDRYEKEAGDEVINLLQGNLKTDILSNNSSELNIFHQSAIKLGITSSRAALMERRALKKLIERAQAEEDSRKESVVLYLYSLVKKYSKLFRGDVGDDTDSQGSTPCSPTAEGSDGHDRNSRQFEKHLTRFRSSNFRCNGFRSGEVPVPPDELRCPISQRLMYDPVIISSGQTYERVCIEKWLNDGHSICPKTQQKLSHHHLIPNFGVRGLVASWCEHYGLPLPNGPPEAFDGNWQVTFSDPDAATSVYLNNIDSSNAKSTNVIPLESCGMDCRENETGTSGGSSYFHSDDTGRYQNMLATLHENADFNKQCIVVEQIRYLLKDDEAARIHMAEIGCVEALVQFLSRAICEGHGKAQEVGALALFNLAVNNNRNKGLLLSAGIVELLELMIENPNLHESATALYLNLSCLDEAKPVIILSQAILFLVQFIQADDNVTNSCKRDALYTLYNLSTHEPNIPSLLSSGILDGICSLLTNSVRFEGHKWVEKVLAVLINIASTQIGRREILATPGLVSVLAMLLDTGKPAHQELTAACLLVMCNGDEDCIPVVLQEGIVPSLVSLSMNGMSRGKEKAQKLLKLFREHRQQDQSLVKQQQQQQPQETPVSGINRDSKTMMCKTRSKKFGRMLSSIWRSKSFAVYQC